MGCIPRKCAIVIAYFLVYVVWGSTYYFIGVALEGFPTFLLGALRFGIAGILLLLLCFARREAIFRPSLIGSSAVSGIILLFVDMAVIMLAQRYVSSSLVAIVASSTAIWIMLLDVPMWKKNLKSRTTVTGLLGGFAGVALLYAEQFLTDNSTHPHSEYGMLILTGGCISWALGTLYTKYHSSQQEDISGFAGSAWQMITASMAFGLCAALSEDFQLMNWEIVPISAWMSLVYLITCGSLLAYSAYVWLLKVRPATEVATHAYINPVVAVILGAGFGGERISAIQLIGLAAILFSVMLTNKNKKTSS